MEEARDRGEERLRALRDLRARLLDPAENGDHASPRIVLVVEDMIAEAEEWAPR